MPSKRFLSCADLDGSSEFRVSRFKLKFRTEDAKPVSDPPYV